MALKGCPPVTNSKAVILFGLKTRMFRAWGLVEQAKQEIGRAILTEQDDRTVNCLSIEFARLHERALALAIWSDTLEKEQTKPNQKEK